MLPKIFKPSGLYDLIRIGKNNDGGYLICKNSLTQSEYLVSFGINNDFSFEEQFFKYKKKKVIAFDPTVTNKFFIKEILLSFVKLNLKSFLFSIINFYKFKKFFNLAENKFFLKKIGKGGNVNQDYISIDTIVKLVDRRKNIFFKIDIEGSEYRILDDILKYQNIISGLAIEFHDVDLNIEKISNFLTKFDLKLVHLHANNWMDYGLNNIPTCLEMSFSKNPSLISDNFNIPHKLDQKNYENGKNIKIEFEN